jgi:hypothetical protein
LAVVWPHGSPEELTVGLGEGQQRRRVLEQAADVAAARVGQAGVALLVVELRLALHVPAETARLG